MQALEKTRSVLAKELGIDLSTRPIDSYREPAAGMFEGEWLGAFAQPSIVMNKATPVSLTLETSTGQSVDEYGPATLLVNRDGDRVRILKVYEGRGPLGEFVYVGRVEHGTLAGYWYSRVRPGFCGVFWYARTDRMEPAAAERLKARVRKTSPKRVVVQLLFGAIVTSATVVGMHAALPGLAILGVGGVGLVVLRRRADALRRHVAAWRDELGT